MTKKKIIFFKSKKVSKNAEFHTDFESDEKMHQKKVISKTSLTNMSKSEKSAFLLITFFGSFFQNFFNGFEISLKFCFFTPFSIFSKKNFFQVILVLFSNFEAKSAKTAQKIKICILDFNFAPIKGYSSFSKKSLIRCAHGGAPSDVGRFC